MLPEEDLPGNLLAETLESYAFALSPFANEHRHLEPVRETLVDLSTFSRGLEDLYEKIRVDLQSEFPGEEEPQHEDRGPDYYFGMLEATDIILDLLAGRFKPTGTEEERRVADELTQLSNELGLYDNDEDN